MTSRPQAILFYAHWHEGTTSVYVMDEHWPPMTILSDELLMRADCNYLGVDGDLITFTVANGVATYRIVERWPTGVVIAQRVDGTITGMAPVR